VATVDAVLVPTVAHAIQPLRLAAQNPQLVETLARNLSLRLAARPDAGRTRSVVAPRCATCSQAWQTCSRPRAARASRRLAALQRAAARNRPPVRIQPAAGRPVSPFASRSAISCIAVRPSNCWRGCSVHRTVAAVLVAAPMARQLAVVVALPRPRPAKLLRPRPQRRPRKPLRCRLPRRRTPRRQFTAVESTKPLAPWPATKTMEDNNFARRSPGVASPGLHERSNHSFTVAKGR